DHSPQHPAPLAPSTAAAQPLTHQHKKWGDIIPPAPGAHNGLNPTTQGQAIYNNDCNLLKGATPVAPQATEPNCEVQSMTVTAPAITGVVWNQTSATLKPGESFTFEATPAAGYTFGPQDQTSWKFTNDFNPERCIEVGPAVIEYKVVCNEEGGIDVTFTNTGESDGEAVLNGEAVNVPAGNSITVSLEDKSQVTIVINDQTVYDQVVTCGGMGGETPETPETPVTSGTVTVAAKPVAKSLPYTAGNQSALIAGVAAATAVVVAILGYAVRFGAKRFQA
ncbi:hypothetical protein KDA23_01840, partial [Candidatus Saccharibacteria bacterium]|nr:hypothetical protein [Candidatus Saccharibacteria bacterium]